MPEPKDPHVQDLKTKALAEGVFRLVEELARKISRNRQAVSRDALMKQTASEMEKIRRFVVGADRKKISPDTAYRITGEYMMRVTQIEEAILESEVEEGTQTGGVTTLKEAFLPVPRKKLIEFQPTVSKQLAKIHEVDEARGQKTDPAWTVFMYEAALKHKTIPDFQADEWYGEAMSQKNALMRKLVLPLVVYDMCERAAKEGARPMPNKEKFMEDRHRAVNALDELIELWDSEMPAVADKYRAVKVALDREMMTLSLYYRYNTRE